jgi:hypothetical protein
MTKRKRIFWIGAGIALLYLLTWIGGPASHEKELASRALRFWNQGSECDAELSKWAKEKGEPLPEPRILSDGPRSRVNWCVPVLPCILLADSSYTIGSLWGEGGVKLVFYCGLFSVEIVTLDGWKS